MREDYVVTYGGAAVGSPPLYELVVAAASAGGLTALGVMLAELPADFPLPLAIVQHLDPNHPSLIADILRRRTALRVKQAQQDDLLEAGVVYVAPPAVHMLVGPFHRIVLSASAPLHHLRPSADRLFVSAAEQCGPVIGVILTGTGTDGAAGASAIRAHGGLIMAQDQGSSAFFGMPQAAIDGGAVDLVLPLSRIAPTIVDLVKSRN